MRTSQKWPAVAPGAEIFYGNVELHAMMKLCDRLSPRTQREQNPGTAASPTITPCLPKWFLATQPRFAETGSRTSLCTSSSTGRSGESSLSSSVRPYPVSASSVAKRLRLDYGLVKRVARELILWNILERTAGLTFQPDHTRWGPPRSREAA